MGGGGTVEKKKKINNFGSAYIVRAWSFLATAQISAAAGQTRSILSERKH